jgi:hypothetical protein
MKLWTAWHDCGATGEGRTLLPRVAYASAEPSTVMLVPYPRVGDDLG